jgi:hypothetical protein
VTDKSVFTDRKVTSDKENVEAAGNRNMRWSQDKIWFWSQYCCSSCGVLFTGDLSSLRIQEALYNKGYAPIATFILILMEVIQLLVAETNKYYSVCLDSVPDMMV